VSTVILEYGPSSEKRMNAVAQLALRLQVSVAVVQEVLTSLQQAVYCAIISRNSNACIEVILSLKIKVLSSQDFHSVKRVSVQCYESTKSKPVRV